MKWPWVSRKRFEEAEQRLEAAQSAADYWNSQYAQQWHRAASLSKALAIETALRRDEQWRRIKAEGHLAYVCDRVQQARGLMLPYVADEPPPMKRKAIPE